MSKTNDGQLKLSLEGVAEWFLAIGAFVYTTGFLVSLNFTDYMGAREATTDLLRAKYVLMGILCLALPVIVIVCCLAVSILKERETVRINADPKATRFYSSMIILAFNLLLTFYLFALFAPKGYVRERPYLVWLIFGVTIVGIRLIDCAAPAIKDHLSEKYHSLMRWVLCGIVVLGLDTYCFWGMRSRLFEIVIPRGMYFVLFIASIAYVIIRLRKRLPDYPNPHDRVAIWLLGITVCSLLYVLLIYIFAFMIYPQIAAGRGGGDFTDTPRVRLYYNDASVTSLPKNVVNGTVSPDLVLVDENEGHFLVADPDDSGGPSAWRNGKGKPEVYAITKAAVSGVTYLSRRDQQDTTKTSTTLPKP